MNETQASQLPVYAGNDLGAVWRSSIRSLINNLVPPPASGTPLRGFAALYKPPTRHFQAGS